MVVLLPAAWLIRCVDHGIPVVYFLAGRRARVVVTSGALDVLTDARP
ncbi:hypothetical protein AB0M11_18705 [Streptomyces sp. NPDC051987]